MRVAIIGARRVRQGLGPYLARFVAEAGHEVVAVVGTREDTAAKATAEVGAAIDQQPVAATDIAGVVAAGAEVLVIASPHATHATWLRHAVEHGMHALCEKPLIWGVEQPTTEARALAAAFQEAGLLLRVNTQWPWTIDTFRQLHPDAPEVPQFFFMRMPPRTTGFAALLDCLSHPLSMLASISSSTQFGADRVATQVAAFVEDLTFHAGGPEAPRWEITFRYAASGYEIDTRLVFDSTPDDERRTTYGLDEFTATRVVDPSDYSMALVDGDARIPLPDPTRRLVRSFLLEASQQMPRHVDAAIAPGMRHLEQIVTAAAHHYGVPRP